MKLWLVVFTMMLSSLPALPESPRPGRGRLHAPTYYIVVSGQLLDDNTILVRGASSLPPGSRIAIQAGDGIKSASESACVSIGEDGLFSQKLHPIEGGRFKWSSNLAIDAVFRTNQCEQSDGVLQVVGKHGQYLGNDNYENRIDTHMQMTPGMINNPQLFQESGWYFGLSASARVSE